ncbi:RsmB/NOP family class I SAM-dependent RNA methyltransferase [Pedobacter insulae]|uniref:16S rRNA (Cytosine967-C5)-methyltransferase n=1 Tax=Pedobacter insulae TaxID=414048 RepID=A0A1I2XW81_9SPHI|nr:RNA methyltransferase [Pedobacter insulae]SFH16976.1 16S rRNA (cytosine967-C5)-methyltransferase [Pedobacter insulae]
MRVEHQIRAFEQIYQSYDGVLPLHRFLFAYFKQNKQMGSSDRRWAARYIYSFFRLGKALSELTPLQRLAIGDFLCQQSTSLVVETYLNNLSPSIELPLDDKIKLVEREYPTFKLAEVFILHTHLSPAIDQAQFFRSFFIQPNLFIRVKGTHIQAVINQLLAKDVPATEVIANALALPNGTKLEDVITDSRLYQVQDLSSQKTGAYFKPEKYDYWWDCCAASGGKSLLLHDIEPNIELLVSDVRENSLNNLDERFQSAGIKKYHKKVIDLLQNNDQTLHHYEFDGILLDAPCSGSGTWGRTPEMLWFFEKYKIESYVKLQKAFAGNVIKYLKPGKPLIYMTCSVFKAENEDVVSYIEENFPVKLEQMELIKGYHDKADSMFVARFIKQ